MSEDLNLRLIKEMTNDGWTALKPAEKDGVGFVKVHSLHESMYWHNE